MQICKYLINAKNEVHIYNNSMCISILKDGLIFIGYVYRKYNFE